MDKIRGDKKRIRLELKQSSSFHNKSNFNQRLEECYGLYGSYNNSDGDISHVIEEKFRKQIILSAFSKLVYHLFSNGVLC